MTEAEWLASIDPQAVLSCLRGTNVHTTELRLETGHPSLTDRKMRLFACACLRQPEVWDGKTCPECNGRQFVMVTPDPDEPWGSWPEECPQCHGTGRIGGLTDPRSRRAVEVAERFADGAATAEELEQAHLDAVFRVENNVAVEEAWWTANAGIVEGVRHILADPRPPGRTRATEAALLRCIFGNPFRPVTPWLVTETKRPEECGREGFVFGELQVTSPTWLTPTVRAVAQSIYDERTWDELPILADALEEAGCTDAAILGHLRPRCPECGGKGVIVDADPHGPEVDRYRCPVCHGTGFAPVIHARGCHVVDAITGRV